MARTGGDEFTIVFPNVTSLPAISITAERLLEDLARPFPSDGQELFVSASIGISLYPDDAGTVDELIKHADAAMYSAKHLGRNNYQFFTTDLNREVQERMLIEGGLRTAIQRNELSLVIQPKIDLATRRVFGAEALLRWNHPEAWRDFSRPLRPRGGRSGTGRSDRRMGVAHRLPPDPPVAGRRLVRCRSR